MPLDPKELDAVCDMVMDLCGVYLDDSKEYLIENRLSDILEKANLENYSQLKQKVQSGDQKLKKEVVNAITTNETLFLRDQSPFDALQHKALPELIDSKEKAINPKQIRIWSAACSTGQEPYSIAMTLCELLHDVETWDIKIYGSDVSGAAVAKAKEGVYSEFETGRGLSPQFISKYFDSDVGGVRVNNKIRAMVQFEERNLHDPFLGMGPFDIVFCRNVAIYFTPEMRSDLFHRIAAIMAPTSYLFVGSSESLADLGPRFEPQSHCRAYFYRPNEMAPA